MLPSHYYRTRVVVVAMSEEMTDEELSLGPGNNQEDVEEWS
jgi:hypothetical protein